MASELFRQGNPISLLVSFFLFLFPATMLTVDNGIGYSLLPLLLLSVFLIATKKRALFDPWSRKDTVILASLLAYPVTAAIDLLARGNWDWSAFDNPSRFLLAIIALLAIRNISLLSRWFYLGCALGSVGAGILGYYQTAIFGWSRASGYTHIIPFGNISLMLGILAATYCLTTQETIKPSKVILWLVLASVPFGIFGSIASGTRGGWLFIPIAVILILHFAVKNNVAKFSALILITVAAATLFQFNDTLNSRMNMAAEEVTTYFQGKNIQTSSGSRLEMWKAALYIFEEQPLLGIGFSNYGEGLSELIAEGKVMPASQYSHAHNEFLNMLAEQGIVGIAVFIATFILPFFVFLSSVRRHRSIAVAGLLLTTGYLVFGLTQVMFSHSSSTTFYAFMLIVLYGLIRANDRQQV